MAVADGEGGFTFVVEKVLINPTTLTRLCGRGLSLHSFGNDILFSSSSLFEASTVLEYDLLARDVLLTTLTNWTIGLVVAIVLLVTPFALLRSEVDFSFAIGLASLAVAVRSAVISC